MKLTLLVLLPILFFCACESSQDELPSFYACQFDHVDSSHLNPNHSKYSELLESITAQGVVGITMAVHRPAQGMWLGASGKADLHNNIDLQSCNITRMGSTIKLFTATVILLIQEEGRIDIDDKISDYLDQAYLDRIENADRATIRQLLQHSSGIYNYIQSLTFQTASLNDLLREWKADELLHFAKGKAAYFEPGTDVAYSNTNYILLGLLIERIEGKPLYQVYEEKLFGPLGLNFSLFAGKNPVPYGIARGYIDLYSNLQVIESTYNSGWDYYTADGGLISNPYDMSQFFEALMDGRILKPTSLNEMLSFRFPNTPDEDFFPLAYGLGIFEIETPQGLAYMHSGDAIGYYANMMYFPDDSTTIVYAVNSNYGQIDQFVSTQEAIETIIEVVKQ